MTQESELTASRLRSDIESLPSALLGGTIGAWGMLAEFGPSGVVLRVPAVSRALQDELRAGIEAAAGAGLDVRFQLEVPRAAAAAGPGLLPGVRQIVAVGSGKGGVGKSTVSANLAVALAEGGARVGLLDADVYGPSIPTMMGVMRQPLTQDGRLLPIEQHGVSLMSLGFLLPEQSSHVIWRGPMVGGAVRQMLADCSWGELDYLVVDLPPGTGDAQLTLAQSVSLTGAVVVMTSQQVAVQIASKAVGMFRRLNVDILGVVGNMDSFCCPNCGVETPVFTRGGSKEAARSLGVPFLGSIPLDPAIVESGDTGTPAVIAEPSSARAEAFRQVAEQVSLQVARLSRKQQSGEGASALFGRFAVPKD